MTRNFQYLIKLFLLCSTLCTGILLCTCNNPFNPPTGLPIEDVQLRETPKGLINQLIKAYENQRLDLFRDLFAKEGDYKFYVAQSFVEEYIDQGFGSLTEVIDDDQYFYVPGRGYYFWRYNEEIERHKRLFSIVQNIRFDSRPTFDTTFVKYTIETVSETLTVSGENGLDTIITTRIDTQNVEFKMADGKLNIEVDESNFSVELGDQVFYLARDPENSKLWVINKWFDLGG